MTGRLFYRVTLRSVTLLYIALLSSGGLPVQAQAITPVAGSLPADSLYQLSIALTNGQGHRIDWNDQAGRPMLVTMFYGDCQTACPIVLKNLQQTVAVLTFPDGRLGVLLVSLDPLHDTPQLLGALAKSHHLDTSIFQLAVAADESRTRAPAAALNIQYRLLENGEISHTTRIRLLDSNGRFRASSIGSGAAPEVEFLRKIRATVKS